MSYTDSGGYTYYTSTADPKDTSRSSDYYTSYDSGSASSSSASGGYPSSTYYSTMTNGYGYYARESNEKKYRDADADNHYITSRTSRDGKVEVICHNKGNYEPNEPLSSEATAEDYQNTQSRHRSKKSARHRESRAHRYHR